LHFHCVVIDGMSDTTAAGGVVFHANAGLDGQHGPGGNGPLLLTPLKLLNRLAALVPPTAPPAPSLLRRARANGRSRKNSAATPNFRSWPVRDTRRAYLDDRNRGGAAVHRREATDRTRPVAGQPILGLA
jgi:hypothetical protein